MWKGRPMATVSETELEIQDPVPLEKTVKMEFSVQEIAQLWCKMGDDGQAQFFVEAAKIMKSWKGCMLGDPMVAQCLFIGEHLAECSCISEDARELVSVIYERMTEKD